MFFVDFCTTTKCHHILLHITFKTHYIPLVMWQFLKHHFPMIRSDIEVSPEVSTCGSGWTSEAFASNRIIGEWAAEMISC